MLVSLIAAMDRNGLIGSGGKLPWHLPGDLKRFRATTWGKPIVMGRKTWESIGRPLPGRLNIVLSSDRGFHPKGARVARSLEEGIAIGSEAVPATVGTEILVIGGASVFSEAIPLSGRFYRTTIDGEFSGDIYFPTDLIGEDEWRISRSESFPAGEMDSFSCRLDILERCTVPR